MEKARVLEDNVLVYRDIERERSFFVTLGQLSKKEAQDLNVFDAWKEFKQIALEIEQMALENDEDLPEPDTTPPILTPEEETKVVKSGPRSGAAKGKLPMSSNPAVKSVSSK